MEKKGAAVQRQFSYLSERGKRNGAAGNEKSRRTRGAYHNDRPLRVLLRLARSSMAVGLRRRAVSPCFGDAEQMKRSGRQPAGLPPANERRQHHDRGPGWEGPGVGRWEVEGKGGSCLPAKKNADGDSQNPSVRDVGVPLTPSEEKFLIVLSSMQGNGKRCTLLFFV